MPSGTRRPGTPARVTLVLLLAAVASAAGAIAVLGRMDCGAEARRLDADLDHEVFRTPSEPEGVSLPGDVTAFLTSVREAFEAHDLDAVMAHVSEDFLHQGMSKAAFREHLGRSFLVRHLRTMRITLLGYTDRDDRAEVAGYVTTDLGAAPQSSHLLPLSEGSQLRRENGRWRWLGDRSESPRGAFRSFRSISATLPPEDPALYRALLPEPFEVPETPRVSVEVTEHRDVRRPLSPYRLGRIQILATHEGQEGWYVVALPETAWMPVAFGRTIGYPKYVVDASSFASTGDGWRAHLGDAGRTILSLDFRPDRSRETRLERWTSSSCLTLGRWLLPDYRPKPTFLLMPPRAGSAGGRVIRATVDSHSTPSLEERFGVVRVSVARDEAWAGLFPEHGEVKGSLVRFAGDFNLRHRILEGESVRP